MEGFSHLSGVTTLSLDGDKCVGCGVCRLVCPHQVFELVGKKAVMVRRDSCMECGACAKNCAAGAISVQPGVGCAAYIISAWLKEKGINLGQNGCCS